MRGYYESRFYKHSWACVWLDVRRWHPTPGLLPGKSHGWRRLVGCSPWDRDESDMTKRLHFHFSLSCIGEGNGNPLQCSCLENPRDGGAWWAAIYEVTESGTRLERLSSSSGSKHLFWLGMCSRKEMLNSILRYRYLLLLLLFSHWVVSNSLQPHGMQHARLPCPSLFPRVCSNASLVAQTVKDPPAM